MSRKEDSKDGNAVVTVNIDDFTRTRDSVIVSLATLQSAVSDLSRAYINHANTVLNRAPSTLDLGGITTSLLENGLLGGHRPFSPSGRSDGGGGKKRKRAPHDPNAPKRALTPYFLYMQHNRSKIANELGTSAKPKEVADEGTKRWTEMGQDEKNIWRNLYQENLAIYNSKKEAYKAGLPIPEDTRDPADQLLQGIRDASHGPDEGEEEDEDEEEEDDEEESESEKEPTPPPRSAKRRRTVDAKPVSTPPTAKKASPEKKKKGASASKEAPATSEKPKRAAAEASRAAAEEAKGDKKRSKKKRKSEAAGSD